MLLYGENKAVAAWVASQLDEPEDIFGNCTAIGIVNCTELIAGIVYSNTKYTQGKLFSLEMSVASVDKRWATRHNLKQLFAYPFIQLGLERVQTICSANEGDTIMFNKRLGFKQEGVHPKGWDGKAHAVSFGMLKGDCKWI